MTPEVLRPEYIIPATLALPVLMAFTKKQKELLDDDLLWGIDE